jgi:phosphoserine phosphatase RsbU/P
MRPDLARIRRRLRTACGEAGVPADDRGRLVLAVTLLAEPALTTGSPSPCGWTTR